MILFARNAMVIWMAEVLLGGLKSDGEGVGSLLKNLNMLITTIINMKETY